MLNILKLFNIMLLLLNNILFYVILNFFVLICKCMIEKKKKNKILRNFKNLNLRIPENYWKDIREIMILTGLSMNAICIDILRPGIKRKLKEIKNEIV